MCNSGRLKLTSSQTRSLEAIQYQRNPINEEMMVEKLIAATEYYNEYIEQLTNK